MRTINVDYDAYVIILDADYIKQVMQNKITDANAESTLRHIHRHGIEQELQECIEEISSSIDDDGEWFE